MYDIRTKGQGSIPPNERQMIKSFLERKEVVITCFEATANVNQNDTQGELKGILNLQGHKYAIML